ASSCWRRSKEASDALRFSLAYRARDRDRRRVRRAAHLGCSRGEPRLRAGDGGSAQGDVARRVHLRVPLHGARRALGLRLAGSSIGGDFVELSDVKRLRAAEYVIPKHCGICCYGEFSSGSEIGACQVSAEPRMMIYAIGSCPKWEQGEGALR